jgi:hypothetical protein
MLQLGRQTWIAVECQPTHCWVGAAWEQRHTRSRTGTGLVTAEWHVWVCLVPCFPLHIMQTRGLRRVPAGDERGHVGGMRSHPPTRETPEMTRSWLTRRRVYEERGSA